MQKGSPLNLIWVNIRHEFRAESSEIQFINHTEERNSILRMQLGFGIVGITF